MCGETKLAGPDADALRMLRVGGLLSALAITAAYLLTLDLRPTYPRDGTSLVVGRDFLNTWMYGRAAFTDEPGRWYDVAAYHEALDRLLGAGYPGQNWSYPPSVLILGAPFALLPYLAALALWTLAGIVILWTVARRLAGRAAPLSLLLSPAALLCVLSGQYALAATALLLAIAHALDRRPLLAGVLVGLLTLKPQIGFLLPVFLALTGRWCVFASAAATTLAIAALTAALFGPQVWIDYIRLGLPTQNLVLADPERLGGPFMPTVFMNLRLLGAPYGAAMAGQLAVSVLAVAALVWACLRLRDTDPRLSWAILLAASVAASPYLLSYDTLPLCAAMLGLLAAGLLDGPGRILAKLVFFLPFVQMGLGQQGLPGGALIAPIVLAYLVLRLPPRLSDRGENAAVA